MRVNKIVSFFQFIFDHQISTAMEMSRQGEDVTDVSSDEVGLNSSKRHCLTRKAQHRSTHRYKNTTERRENSVGRMKPEGQQEIAVYGNVSKS